MLKKIKVYFLIVLILWFFIDNNQKKEVTLSKNQIQDITSYHEKKKEIFGILTIPDINLENPIYQKDAKENHVDQNIQLLEETMTEKNSYIVLASHSGNGPHAYFKNLENLKNKAKIYLTYQENQREYELIKKEEVPKTGEIYLEKYNFPYLVLITCSKTVDNIQEVYYAKFIQ